MTTPNDALHPMRVVKVASKSARLSGGDARRAERRDGAESRATAVCSTNFRSPYSWLPRHCISFPYQCLFPAFWFSFLLHWEVFLPKDRQVRLADRCRRLLLCLADRPRTSSYPDSWDPTQRPLCRL